jgi:hypothetical protein
MVKHQMALGIFSGDMENNDVDGAIAELERAGYRVLRMPDALISMLADPDDYFIEIFFDCTDTEVDENWNRLRKIVRPYGGDVDDVGAVEEGHVPFRSVFVLSALSDEVIELNMPAKEWWELEDLSELSGLSEHVVKKLTAARITTIQQLRVVGEERLRQEGIAQHTSHKTLVARDAATAAAGAA